MIDYGKPASNQMQMQLPGCSDVGAELMEEARKWVARHPHEWIYYKEVALEQCSDGTEASPNFCLQTMRNRMKVSVRNSYAPAFARIAMEQDKNIKFRVAASSVDGFTTAKL